MGMLRKEIKWADGSLVKKEIDDQLAAILGPKTAEDSKPLEKVKQKKPANKPAKASPTAADQAPAELSFSGFHKAGENYTTEGYVVTSHTMRLLAEHLQQTGGQIRWVFGPLQSYYDTGKHC